MTRCFTSLFLAFALLGAFVYSFSSANAADDTSTPAPAAPADSGTSTATPATSAHKTVIPDVPKHFIPSRSAILEKIANGKYLDAESDYLEWENAWQQVDPALLIAVESHILQKQYADGDVNALFALLHAGDEMALQAVRTMVRTGKTELTPEQYTAAVLLLANRQELPDYNLFINLLKNKDLTLGNLAITALGYYGNKKAITPLTLLLGEADIDRSILIVKSVMKLSGKAQLLVRYNLELKSPLPGIPDRAALLLTITGSTAGWNKLQKMLDDKTEGFYPQALSVLGNLSVPDTEAYVTSGLAGSEAEQMNALASINALSSDQIVPALLKIIDDKAKSDPFHFTALNLLAEQGSTEAQTTLRNIAFSDKEVNSMITANAIYLLADAGLINTAAVRTLLYQQLFNDDKAIATASRGALLVYGQNAPR